MSIHRKYQDSKNEQKWATLLAMLPSELVASMYGGRTDTTVGTAGAGVEESTNTADRGTYVTLLVFSNLVLGTPTAGGNTAHGALIYTFPTGAHVHLATWFSVGLTIGTVTTDTPDVGIGSAVGTGAQDLLSGVGATAEDYITGQTWAVALDGAVTEVGPLGATAGILTGISLNKLADAKTVYLNAADGWAAGVTGNLTASGLVVLLWTKMI